MQLLHRQQMEHNFKPKSATLHSRQELLSHCRHIEGFGQEQSKTKLIVLIFILRREVIHKTIGIIKIQLIKP